MPAKAATRRKARAVRAAVEDASVGDASVDEDAGSVARARPEPAGPAAPSPRPEPEEDEPLITTLRIPGYLAENIRRWLFENPGQTQHSMFFAGLAKLGIEVCDEDLKPRRRPRSSRGRR